jgi:RNA recognition motif-containing protein
VKREEPRPAKQQHVKNPRNKKRKPEPVAKVDGHPVPRATQKRKPTPDGSLSLHISNLPWGVTDDDVRVLFSPYGKVKQATVIIDNRGRSKGFGFIDMPYPDAQRALKALDGSKLSGRPLKVKLAAPRAKRS